MVLLPSNEALKTSRAAFFGASLAMYSGRDMPTTELFNELVSNIRHEWAIQHLGEKVRTKRKLARLLFLDYCNYIDALFEKCARLVVLRIDLGYKKELSDS